MVRTAARPVPHHRRASRRKSVNKRKTNWLRLALGLALTVLLLECVAVALLSPRFQVKKLAVEGVVTLPVRRITAQLPVSPTQNLFLAPVQDWEKNITRLPGVERVTISRKLPGKIHIKVTERTPWASVKIKNGLWHTIDANFIPFRTTKQPETGLLSILVADLATWEALLGVPLPSAGLETARECVHWAQTYSKFPLTEIEIDSGSGVSLKYRGCIDVQIGSGEHIKDKLTSLETLLLERSDLVSSNRIAYINIFAAQAPAIGFKNPTIEKLKRK